jgi:transposase
MTCEACGEPIALGFPGEFTCDRCGHVTPRRNEGAAAAGLAKARRLVADARARKGDPMTTRRGN